MGFLVAQRMNLFICVAFSVLAGWNPALAADRLAIDDDFTDGTLNANLWSVTQSGPMAVSEIKGAIAAVTPGNEQAKGRLALATAVHGNLSVEIEYEAKTYAGGADGRILLLVQGPSSYASVYYHRFDTDRCEAVFGGTLSGGASIYAYREQVPNKGKLRLARTGSTFTAAYWQSGSWRTIGSREGFTDDAVIRIQFQSTSANPAFDFRVTRFHLDADGASAPLAISGHPEGCGRYVDEGPFSLKVSAAGGFGPIKYEWFHDPGSGPVPAGTGETLTIAKPTATASGKYICKVSDANTTLESKPAVVRIGERIQFTQHPTGGRRYTGEGPLTLAVAAKGGVGTLSYAWRHETGGEAKTVSTAASYTISTPTAAHSGKYWCETTDGRETVKSNTAEWVIADPLGFPEQPATVRQYVDGGPLILQAKIGGGLGTISYRWFKNGVDTPVSTEATFTKEAPTAADAGLYRCEVRDERGTARSNEVEVLVADHLVFEQHPASVRRYVDAGPLTLQAVAKGGLGPIAYQWYIQGKDAPVSTANPYTIAAPVAADSGVYWCEARDERETVKSNTAAITIADHLAFQQHPTPVTGPQETPLTVQAATTGGLGPVSYRWFVQGKEAPVSTANPCVLAAPMPSDSGVYWCEAQDEFETIRSNTAAIVIEPKPAVSNTDPLPAAPTP